MGIRKKGRRRIDVGGRSFVWYVCEDADSLDLVLHVCSEDKHFLVKYHLGRRDDPIMIVMGRDFPGVPDAGGCWLRFRCPRWETPEGITPGGVRRLIEWATSPDKPLVAVDWRNAPIASGPPVGLD